MWSITRITFPYIFLPVFSLHMDCPIMLNSSKVRFVYYVLLALQEVIHCKSHTKIKAKSTTI